MEARPSPVVERGVTEQEGDRRAPEAAAGEENSEPAPEPEESSDERAPIQVLTGRASYYSDSLAGNRTASGERYDPRALTAASRDLPFGAILRVTRLPDGPSVVVRVNDRGPFRDRRRVLDLSRAAAERLGMIRAGVVEVRAEVLELPGGEGGAP